MSLTFNTKTYSADKYGVDSVGYIGAAKTTSVQDDLALSRTSPKPTTVFSGVGRTKAKLNRTVTLTGALTPTSVASLSIDVVVPVGMASADIDALLNDMGAFLSGADFKTHVKGQKISF
jgi:hypothetical protein